MTILIIFQGYDGTQQNAPRRQDSYQQAIGYNNSKQKSSD